MIFQNGYRLSGGSQPTSPIKGDSSFSFPEKVKETPDVTQVMQVLIYKSRCYALGAMH